VSSQEIDTVVPDVANAAKAEESLRRRLGSRIFPAFSVPVYRRYVISFCGSSFGFQNQELVRAWLAYSLHRSAAELGLVVLMSAIAQGLGAPIGGVIADRFDRKRIMVWTQGISFAASAMIGVLVILGVVQIWHLVLLALVTGAATSLHMPARQSIVFDIVGPKYLANALAINGGLMSGMRLFAPAIGGLVINVAGIGPAYFLSVAAYAVSMATLTFVVPKVAHQGTVKRESPFHSLVEGMRYLYRVKPLFWLYIFSTGSLLIASPFRDMMSPFAVDQLGGDERTLGFIVSLMGLGAILGSIVMAALSGYRGKASLLLIGSISWALLLVALAYVPSFSIGVPLFIAIGIAQAIFTTCVTIMMQSNVEDAYRGRMLSFHLISYSLPGFTTLALGHVVDAQGVQVAFVSIGIMLLVFVIALGLWRKDVRALR